MDLITDIRVCEYPMYLVLILRRECKESCQHQRVLDGLALTHQEKSNICL
eukprot:m.35653 g.35653  ORF g.35653 m.35653 type:complete len:50 (-) comp8918_c0_seq2:1925-2074(-)